MAKCIYCAAEDLSREHHLPACLGKFKGYVYLEDHVCTHCNGICGRLDEQLCRSGGEAFFRKYLGIEGRKEHEKVNPFYRGGSGGGRLEMVGTDRETGDNMLLELVSEKEARELRCAKLIADDGSIHIIPIKDNMTPEEFRARVDALGIKHFKEGHFFAAPEEIPWVESLLARFTYEGKTEWSHRTGPIIYGPSTIKFTVTNRYFRDIAKIGFHYFLTKMPQFRGDEPYFVDIRHFIMNESTIEECTRFVSYTLNQLAWQLGAGQRLKSWGHLVCAETDYFNFRAKVQLFAGPQVRPMVYTVQLGKNPSRIDYTEARGDFFAYYLKEERGDFDGEVSELVGIRRK